MKEFTISFKDIPHQITKDNNEYVLLSLLHRFEKEFPQASKEIIENIISNEIEDITKSIRQTSNEENSVFFYEILNGDFGFKIMKILKKTYLFEK